jgi:hypothetical protein
MVKAMLNQLAEFESQKDSITATKQALLDEVKLPAEVQAIIDAGTKELAGVQDEFAPGLQSFTLAIEAELADIVIPAEIAEAIAAIDAQRAAVRAKQTAYNQDLVAKMQARRQAIQTRINTQVKAAYDAVDLRRAEIEAEFVDSTDAVNANIEALRQAIKDAAKEFKHTVKGEFYMAVYVSGRITWNTDGLDSYVKDHPEVKHFRKEGDPSITLKRV